MDTVPERIGDWLPSGILGKGGMGVVYDARHRETHVRAALKTVRAPREMSISGIRREIHALAAVDHPGIVRVLDHGLHEGLPWYAMEYLEGDDLFGWTGVARPGRTGTPRSDVHIATQQLVTSDLPSVNSSEVFIEPFLARVHGAVPAELRTVLTVVRRMCVGLEFIHGMGIVHRDLKPENLIVRANGMPVLVDFGLMSRASSRGGVSREEVQGADTLLAGTVFYVAPEQIRGEFVDARADLYALGCMLFELLTGKPPFEGIQTEIMMCHLEEPPPRASELREGVPEALDALIIRLMAKRPEDRFGHATDVARALIELGAAPEMPEACPRARTFLYRPVLAGRSLEVKSVHTRLRDAQDGHGGMQFIGGAAGVGKTRLAMEMVRDAKLAGFRVMVGECVAGGPPLHPLVPLIRSIADHCMERGPLETHRLLRGAEILAAYEPTVGAVLGAALEPEVSGANRPLASGRQSVVDVVLTVLRRLSEEKPLLLLLDDVQWLDELTLAALTDWAQQGVLSGLKMLVLGTYREDEFGPGVAQLLDAPVRKLALRQLEADAVAQMVAGMLALPNPPQALVDYVVELSEGNPFFVAEYLLAAVDRGLLARDPRGAWKVSAEGPWAGGPSVSVPEGLGELVDQRLDGLPAGQQRVLEAMSVLGRQAEVRLVQEVAGVLPFDFYDAVAELVARQVLIEPEAEYLRFAHDRLREAMLARMDSDTVVRCHGAAAAALEARRASLDPSRFGALGHHWEQAGHLDNARDAYLPAAKHALRQFATQDAERLALAYLRLVETPTRDAVSLRLKLAHLVYIQAGRTDEAQSQCETALLDAGVVGDLALEARALRRLAHVRRIVGDTQEALTYGKAAVEVADRAGIERLRGHARQTLGNVYHDLGELKLASETFRQALESHRSCDDEWSEGYTQVNLGLVDVSAGRASVGRRRYERALEIFEGTGDLRGLGLALHNLSTVVYWHARDRRRALELVDRAAEVAARAGNRRQQTVSLAGSARMNLELGNLARARERLEEGLILTEQMNARRGFCHLLVVRAEFARLVDADYDAAEVDLARALEWIQKHDLGSLRFLYLCQRCLLRLARGEVVDEEYAELEALAVHGVTQRDRQSWAEVMSATSVVRDGGRLHRGNAIGSLTPELAEVLGCSESEP